MRLCFLVGILVFTGCKISKSSFSEAKIADRDGTLGTLSIDDKKVPVGLLFFEPSCEDSSQRVIYTCGGTRVGSEWVLTAGHCANWEGDQVDRIVAFNDIDKLQEILPIRKIECSDASRLDGKIATAIASGEAVEADTDNLYFADGYKAVGSPTWLSIDVAFLKVDGLAQKIIPMVRTDYNKKARIIGIGTKDCFVRHDDEQYRDLLYFDPEAASAYGQGVGEFGILGGDELRRYLAYMTQPDEEGNPGLDFIHQDKSLYLQPTGKEFTCSGDSGSGILQDGHSFGEGVIAPLSFTGNWGQREAENSVADFNRIVSGAIRLDRLSCDFFRRIGIPPADTQYICK